MVFLIQFGRNDLSPTILLVFTMVLFTIMGHSVASQNAIQPVQISARLGVVMDKSERDYFNLFPTFTNFHHAVVVEIHKGTLTFNIFLIVTHGDSMVTTLDISIAQALALQEYIEDFETQLSKDNLSNNLFLIGNGTLIAKPQTVQRRHTSVVISVHDSIYKGYILYADSSTVLINESKEEWWWKEPSKNVRRFSFNSIDTLTIQTRRSLGSAMLTPILVFSGLGSLAGIEIAISPPKGHGQGGYGLSWPSGILAGLFYGCLIGAPIGAVFGSIFYTIDPSGPPKSIAFDSSLTVAEKLKMLQSRSQFGTSIPPELWYYIQHHD